MNAAKALGDEESLLALIHEVQHQVLHWSVIFVSEFDGTLSQRELTYNLSHHVHRHWPGPGSFAIGIIVNSRARPYLRSLTPHGRAICAYFKSDVTLDLTLVGVHGGHGEALAGSLADTSFLLRSSPRLSNVLVVGDQNVDLLPSQPHDPWASRPLRQQHHSEQRDLLHAFCQRFHLNITIPTMSRETLTGPWAPFAANSIFSRVPVGGQIGIPSLLDYPLGSHNVVSSSSLFWSHISDHAINVIDVHARLKFTQPRPKRNWLSRDWVESTNSFRAMAPASFRGWTDFTNHIARLQASTGVATTCAERRRHREPEHIKNLRRIIRSNQDPSNDSFLKKQLWNARKTWLSELKAAKETLNLSKGKPVIPHRKLSTINSMQKNGTCSIDFPEMSTWISTEFQKRWRCNDLHRHSIIKDELARNAGLPVTIPGHLWLQAAETPNRQAQVDYEGHTLSCFRIALLSASGPTTDLFNRLIQDNNFVGSLVVSGRALGKKRGTVTPEQVRAITPFSNILILFDCVLDIYLKEFINKITPNIDPGYFETAIPGRQILDTTFALSQHIEKSLDDYGRGCVAAADVAAFFDNIDPIKVLRWLLHRDFPRELAVALLRLHCLPSCQLQVGRVCVDIGRRSCGLFTGTRTAGTAARIPLLDAADQRCHVWNRHSSNYNGVNFSITSFVDNVFTAAPNLSDATAVLNDLELFLRNRWGLRFGDASKEVLIVEGLDVGDLEPSFTDTWAVKRSMRCLGHILTSNGSIEDDFKKATTCMWATFWMNYRPSLTKASKKSKLRFLQGCVSTIARFKWSRWPWQVTYARRLDQVQTHMLSLLFPCVPVPGEPPTDFYRRRSLLSGRLATAAGRWSRAWAESVCSWHDHCCRAHDHRNWNSYIYTHKCEAWLAERRIWNSRGQETHRTNTRAAHGKVTRRFFEGHKDALMALS